MLWSKIGIRPRIRLIASTFKKREIQQGIVCDGQKRRQVIVVKVFNGVFGRAYRQSLSGSGDDLFLVKNIEVYY